MPFDPSLLVFVVIVIAFLAYYRGRDSVLGEQLAEECRKGGSPGRCGQGRKCTHHPSWKWVEPDGWQRRDRRTHKAE